MNFKHLYAPFEGQKQHGLVCPLGFLQTKNSSQIGEYPDLILLGRWAKKAGFTLIQLLPLFDTGDQPSPYSARSCFALNPIFLSLKQLKGINTRSQEFKALYAKSNTPFFDYQTIYNLKMTILRGYVASLNLKKDPLFLDFYHKNSWLKEYGAYCAYTKRTTSMPHTWHVECDQICAQDPDEVLFHQALQFFCYTQLTNAKAELEAMGLFMIGDIPILLSPHSVEMWTHKELFDCDHLVGAPPDQYSDQGQLWGFPRINFSLKPQECTNFWLSRLHHMAPYFSVVRIDHFVGFFRLWTIAKNKKATEGVFFPGSDQEALLLGSTIVESVFTQTPVAPIVEDLGSIPDYVKTYIKTHNICGTKVLRWERAWDGDGCFIPLNQYPFYSMATLSTHDSTFMFDEWTLHPQEAQTLAKALNIPYTPLYTPALQEQILQKIHNCSSLFVINMIQEYLYLHPKFQNLLPRVNDPNNNQAPNWKVKMILPIEELLDDESFTQKIHSLFI